MAIINIGQIGAKPTYNMTTGATFQNCLQHGISHCQSMKRDVTLSPGESIDWKQLEDDVGLAQCYKHTMSGNGFSSQPIHGNTSVGLWHWVYHIH